MLAGIVGCGDPSGGFLIRPVPADQRLQETVVQSDKGWTGDKIAIIELEGLIMNARPSFLWNEGENPVSLLAEKLRIAAADPKVKAVLLRVNSPGGTVQASEAMYELLLRFGRQSGKPVVAYIMDMGASGAYYVSCAAGRILCQSTSITGSIGVIMQTVSFAGTMQKLGISADAICSGPHKDMASPLKELSPEDRKILQDMINEFYGKFVSVVCAGRKDLSPEKARQLADGRVYTGKQAVELGLVDRVCDMQEALDEAKAAAKVKSARVVMYHRPLGYKSNVYSSAADGAGGQALTQFNLLNVQANDLSLLRRPTFLYLWTE